MSTSRSTPFVALGAGAALGALATLAAMHRGGPPPNPRFAAWQVALARERGAMAAAMTMARARARYRILLRDPPAFEQPALRSHLVDGILPALALYRTLRDEIGDQDAALRMFDLLMRAWVAASPRARLIRAVDRLPLSAAYTAIRLGNRAALARDFPDGQAGWTINVVEDSDQRIAYDITECFYQKVLAAYGAPELTAHFCALDDELFGRLKRVRFTRAETLGRGNTRCDFCFSRIARTADQAQGAAVPDIGR